MRKNLCLASLVALSLLSSSCAGAPEGFALELRLSGVRMSAVDNVRIIITPQTSGSITPRFQPPEETSFEDGGVQLSVDDDGRLVILITGDYFQANAMPTGEGDLDPVISLELWSDDETPRMMTPQIQAIVVAGGFDAAAGAAYLPTWPLELGDSFTLTVPCTAGRETECRPAP